MNSPGSPVQDRQLFFLTSRHLLNCRSFCDFIAI
jgi:hypothetical protein